MMSGKESDSGREIEGDREGEREKEREKEIEKEKMNRNLYLF